MKKPIAIVVTLIILTIVIGFERIGRGLQLLISDNRTEQASPPEVSAEEGIGDSRDNLLPRLRQDSQKTHPLSRSSEQPDLLPGLATRSDDDPEGATLAIDVVGGNLSLMRYIRSSDITGSSEISPTEIELLRRTGAILGVGLDPGTLIFDADALSTSEAPFILFARDEYDLTEEAKLIYEKLLAEHESSTKTVNIESQR